MAALAIEVHHCVPRYLIGFFDRAASGELHGAAEAGGGGVPIPQSHLQPCIPCGIR
jgi:hypothetical protein